MKRMLLSLAIFVTVLVLGLVVLSVMSRRKPDLGLVNGQLRPCERPGICVCSEGPGANTGASC